jgi:prophage regulatory protein
MWRSGCYLPDNSTTAKEERALRARIAPTGTDSPAFTQRIRLLRLAHVMEVTGLKRTKIYALQAQGDFPMRVQITPTCVGWLEHEVQAWIAKRVTASAPLVVRSSERSLGRARRDAQADTKRANP